MSGKGPAAYGQMTQSEEPQPEPEQSPTALGPVAETNLKEINLMLDMIRSNLANIARTWGRDSPQYRSAKEIMQAYLAENVARLRERKGTRTTSIDDEMDTTHPPDSASKTRQIERSIEELMDGLELD